MRYSSVTMEVDSYSRPPTCRIAVRPLPPEQRQPMLVAAPAAEAAPAVLTTRRGSAARRDDPPRRRGADSPAGECRSPAERLRRDPVGCFRRTCRTVGRRWRSCSTSCRSCTSRRCASDCACATAPRGKQQQQQARQRIDTSLNTSPYIMSTLYLGYNDIIYNNFQPYFLYVCGCVRMFVSVRPFSCVLRMVTHIWNTQIVVAI